MHVVATAGHVDHGKSTLLHALTGMQPDRWEEEQRRGLTIDLGFVWTDLEGSGADPLTVAFVDVPGHERFVPNMLAGAGAVPLALFVVAADDGWKAQSQEHLDILDLLGVPAAVVAVTKVGVAGDDRASEVASDVARRVAGTSLEGAPVVMTDAVDGRGLDELRGVLARRLEAVADPPDRGRPRLWIDRSFTISGAGTVVTGTLAGGVLVVGQDAAVLPSGIGARVRSLQSLGKPVDAAAPGTRVAVNLAGVDHDDVGRGHAVVGPAARGDSGVAGAPATAADAWVVTRRADVVVRALPDQEIGRTGAWHLHVGSAEVAVEISPLLGEPVPGGSDGLLHLELDHPLPLATGDRFVLRESGRQATVGGGEILDPAPPAPPRGTDARLHRAELLDAVAAQARDDRLAALVDAAGGARPTGQALAAADVVADAAVLGGLTPVGGFLVTGGALASWNDAVVDLAAEHHRENPASRGATRRELGAAATAAGCPPALAPEVVDHLAATGTLRRDGSSYALPEHVPAVDEAKAARRTALLDALMGDPFAPPELDDVAREVGAGHEEINELVQAGEIVRSGGIAFARAAVQQATQRLAELQDEVGDFTASQAREALGTTRKYAIPLLEHLDGTGVTRFDGTHRTLTP